MNTPELSIYSFDKQAVSKARIQLHYAIQPLAATSFALNKSRKDFSHMAIQWNDRFGFITQPINGIKSYRVALDPITLTLEILSDRDQIISVFPLDNRTILQAFEWIKIVVKGLGDKAELIAPISYPPDDFPDSDIANGGTFERKNITSNLADYYGSANSIIRDIIQQEPTASPVRIWPHHFDIATLISIAEKTDSEPKTIGVGLSPGDRNYDEPYWYVTPYPYPQELKNLPLLNGNGFWHTENWIGAVLTSSQFGEPKISIDQVKTFLDSAINACKNILT